MNDNDIKSLDHRSAIKDTDDWPSKYSKLFIEVSIVTFGSFMVLYCLVLFSWFVV